MPTIVETTPLGRRVIDPDVNRRFNIQTQMQADQMGQQERMRQAELQAMREIQGTYGQRQAGEERLQQGDFAGRGHLLGQAQQGEQALQRGRYMGERGLVDARSQADLQAMREQGRLGNEAYAFRNPNLAVQRALSDLIASQVPAPQAAATDGTPGTTGVAPSPASNVFADEEFMRMAVAGALGMGGSYGNLMSSRERAASEASAAERAAMTEVLGSIASNESLPVPERRRALAQLAALRTGAETNASGMSADEIAAASIPERDVADLERTDPEVAIALQALELDGVQEGEQENAVRALVSRGIPEPEATSAVLDRIAEIYAERRSGMRDRAISAIPAVATLNPTGMALNAARGVVQNQFTPQEMASASAMAGSRLREVPLIGGALGGAVDWFSGMDDNERRRILNQQIQAGSR